MFSYFSKEHKPDEKLIKQRKDFSVLLNVWPGPGARPGARQQGQVQESYTVGM